jgi:torulene dioxygenase
MELSGINKYASCRSGYRCVYATGGNASSAPGREVSIGRLGNGYKVVQAAFFSCIAKTDLLTGKYLH